MANTDIFRQLVNKTVTWYQMANQGQLPGYVWVPSGSMPDQDLVQSWAIRGVAICTDRSNARSWVATR